MEVNRLMIVIPLLVHLFPLYCQGRCTLDKKGRSAITDDHPRFTRSIINQGQDEESNSIYFDGQQFLKLKEPNDSSMRFIFPRDQFTVSMWTKPEGGQFDPAVLLELSDICSKEGQDRVTIQIGIATRPNGNRNRRGSFYALVKSEMVNEPNTLWSLPYKPSTWTHLALTYDGGMTRLYENGARVAASTNQVGPLFASIRSPCKQLFLGRSSIGSGSIDDSGIHRNGTSFRGFVHTVVIQSRALSHGEIARFRSSYTDTNSTDLVLLELFRNLDRWDSIGRLSPRFVKSAPTSWSTHFGDLRIKIPPCGQTVCDNPDVITNYVNDPSLRGHKELRYRVVNVLDNDGTNPIVSMDKIHSQHDILNTAFAPSNISWRLEIVQLRDTNLRRKTIVFGCDSSKVGNGQCDLECRDTITANDGGDCDQETGDHCRVDTMEGNGQCDPECNRPQYHWDWGECCTDQQWKMCIDPQSPKRAYIGIDEYKRILNFSNEHQLTVAFADWSDNELIGLSTFPWEKEVFSIYGGIILQPNRFGVPGHGENLVHEIGHALGLWHVHHGVSELHCDDPCRETEPSLLTGDLCGDTRPTPKNTQCKDPNSSDFSTNGDERKSGFSGFGESCGKVQYTDTPYTNYMSYTGEECTDHFTAHQTARMHCYIDLLFHSWRPKPTVGQLNGVLPVPPRVMASSSRSVTIAWTPPLTNRLCAPPGTTSGHVFCTADGRILQYAARAYSPGPSKLSGYWAPHQAVGPPDAEPCEASTKAWLPDATNCNDDPSLCLLILEFEIAVVAESFSLWVGWNAGHGIRQILLHYIDGSVESVHSVVAYCDVPFTAMISTAKALKKMDVYTSNPFINIDAVQIVTAPGVEQCRQCDQWTYRVHRTPPYPNGSHYLDTKENIFVDESISRNQRYEYRIQTMSGSIPVTNYSPPLEYFLGMGFCADGRVDEETNEECDDGNAVDGDGCSSSCKLEEHFACKGEPGLCYIHAGDGECEDFERPEIVQDCGFYTPDEFIDQWPVEIVTNALDPFCNASMLVGPAKYHACGSSDLGLTWRVCGGTYWRDNDEPSRLKAVFDKAVVATSVLVHLANSGIDDQYVKLELISDDGDTYEVKESQSIPLSCKENGIVEYRIWHDLSQPFFYSRSVVIHFVPGKQDIVLAGLRLRSRGSMDPVVVQHCSQTSTLYSPELNQCLDDRCVNPRCPPIDVENGQVKCTIRNGGDDCLVTCQKGYRIVDAERKGNGHAVRVTCHNGQWSSKKIECRPIDCGIPKMPHARVDCVNGTTYGERCTFYCVPPAIMIGSRDWITCGKNGIWSLAEAYCQPSCSTTVLSDARSKAISKLCRVHYKSVEAASVTFPIGATCKFVCKPGYHVDGQGRNKRLFRKICGDDGRWTGPECVRVQCREPKLVYSGVYNCTNGFNIGSYCSFYCPGTKQARSSMCDTDGEWTVAEPCSLPMASCSPPRPLRDIRFQCSRKLLIGSTCTVSCRADGYDPVQEHIVVDENNFKMQILQKVNYTTCSVQKSWQPSVHLLACVKRCAREFVGDGWCDFQNNRGYCAWDGGDCCASTVKGGKVKLMFPALCTSHLCRCLDPYAIENRNDVERSKLLSTVFRISPSAYWQDQRWDQSFGNVTAVAGSSFDPTSP